MRLEVAAMAQLQCRLPDVTVTKPKGLSQRMFLVPMRSRLRSSIRAQRIAIDTIRQERSQATNRHQVSAIA